MKNEIVNIVANYLSNILIKKVMEEHPYYFNGRFEKIHNKIKRMTSRKNPDHYTMMEAKRSCKIK